MATPKQNTSDIEAILSHRHDNGADFWATEDGRWGKGSPFSTFDCILLLSELGLKKSDPTLRGAAERILSTWREDGRFRPAPKGSIFPCHTANAARALCRVGFARDKRLKRTFEHFFETQHDDGGWRCNRAKMGLCAETDASNPGVTLSVLDAFRFTTHCNRDKRLDKAVRSLLSHWDTRVPMGPCHFGIGSRFLQVEYPFLRYNLFWWVFVLSHYRSARKNPKFKNALGVLREKLIDNQIVIENSNRALARLSLCKKGEPSRLATKRYREILKNLGS